MLGMRDRSVVTSSVIPSAKYCLSGLLLRLANGSTTIDRRGATKGCGTEAAATISGAVESFGSDSSHHAPTPRRATAPTEAAIPIAETRCRRDTMVSVLNSGTSATASGRIGEAIDGGSAAACVTAATKQ